MDKNQVILDVKVVGEPREVKSYGVEKIYEVDLEYKYSDTKTNTIQVHYPSGVVTNELKKGDFITVEGELRSLRHTVDDGKEVTKIYILAKKITLLESEPEQYRNHVRLTGKLTREPVFGTTSGDNTSVFSSFSLRVDRKYNKFSILPCVVWGNKVNLMRDFEKGSELEICGFVTSHFTSNDYLIVNVSVSFIDVATKE